MTVLTAPTVGTTATAPAVRVLGNQLVAADGGPVRLLGVNKAGTEYACAQGWGIFDGPVDEAAIAAMLSWRVTAVRVPLNEHCWLARNDAPAEFSGEAYRGAVEAYVDRLHAAGLVAVLDLHWSAPGGTLARGQALMADADHSTDFWTSVAGRFRDDPAVVFELFNEPHDISWECWQHGCLTTQGWRAAGMQQLLDAVRASGARQPVIVTGMNWGGDLSQWLEHSPTDPLGQIVAGVHVYSFSQCRDAACWDSTIGRVAGQVPVVTTELGEDTCTGDFVREYLGWAERHEVDYLGWTWNTWDCRSGPALISSTDGTPTAFGAALRDQLLAIPLPPTVTASPTASPTPTPTQTTSPTKRPRPTKTPKPRG